MNLYLISQNGNTGWDTYDSAVVAAETDREAQAINPCLSGWDNSYGWCRSPASVIVEYIGVAKPDTKKGIICSSFNAG